MEGVRFVVLGLLAVVAGGAAAQAAKSDFPSRPLRYIVPFPPGGSTDLVARIVSVPLSEELGRQIVIDNRAGAAGTVGAEIAAHATPDGYTIFACNIASLAVSPALYKKLNYDPVAGFAPIGLIGSTANALAVHPSVPARTIAEFIALAKNRPGKINYASAGVGTSPQLSMELFLLGVTSSTRHPDLPDVPTIAESGMPGFEVVSWQGLCTPAAAPEPVRARLRAALATVLASPETQKQLADQGMQTTPLLDEKFAAFIRSERAKWKKLVKDVGIPLL